MVVVRAKRQRPIPLLLFMPTKLLISHPLCRVQRSGDPRVERRRRQVWESGLGFITKRLCINDIWQSATMQRHTHTLHFGSSFRQYSSQMSWQMRTDGGFASTNFIPPPPTACLFSPIKVKPTKNGGEREMVSIYNHHQKKKKQLLLLWWNNHKTRRAVSSDKLIWSRFQLDRVPISAITSETLSSAAQSVNFVVKLPSMQWAHFMTLSTTLPVPQWLDSLPIELLYFHVIPSPLDAQYPPKLHGLEHPEDNVFKHATDRIARFAK